MKRFVSVWLPHWPTDRWRRQWRQRNSAATSSERAPLVLFAPVAGALSITAVDRRAAARGLRAGQRLADARAIVPGLRSAPADAAGDAADLDRLADWATRYTPWAARDGEDGLILDIAGCAHLFGGEAALIADLQRRLARLDITALAAVAATPAAAWAFARYDGKTAHEPQPAAIDPARDRARLAGLPVAALRLPDEQIAQLGRFGLRRIGDLVNLPRAPLTARLGIEVVRRLDLMFDAAHEPISPRRPVACWQARLAFPDGIARREDIDQATRHLLDDLCARLAEAGRGARALELVCYRLDGMMQTVAVGAGKPTHQMAHLFRLFEEKLGILDPGFGIETMLLNAIETDPLALHQADLTVTQPGDHDLSDVIDRLRNRLGPKRVMRLAPHQSHWPERAVKAVPALSGTKAAVPWRQARLRPLHLLTRPEPIEIGEEGTESDRRPPLYFRWRRSDYRVARAEGPERIEPEWWRGGHEPARDYFWVQDGAGRRFWIYRSRGAQGQWYLHGLFA